MEELKKRMFFLTAIFSLILSLLIFRLYVIQLVDTQSLSNRAVSTRAIKLADSIALRGTITDRNYKDLSDGGWSFKTNPLGYKIPYYERFGDNPLAVHVIGHLDYSKKDGLAGAEAWYNSILKASKSAIFAEKDVNGHVIKGKGAFVYPPVNNARYNLVLTLDKDIQKIAEDVSDGKYDAKTRLENGALVVMDVQSGDLLAVVSRPTFNPNKPVPMGNKNLLNKALNFYYPGSVFKIIVAAAAYDQNLISEEEKFYCNGRYSVNSKVYISCWKLIGHGEQTFTEAFANSCNPSFISIGQKVYKKGLEEYISRFHLDRQEVIGFPHIQGGNIQIGIGKAALANASIGQEGIKLSPVQVAATVATVARGGQYLTPRLVKEIRVLNGQVVKSFEQQPPKQIIKPSTAKKLQVMMEEVTKTGTGTDAWIEQGSAGKTGSAQTGMKTKTGEEIVHAWFAGFAPSKQPKYAIVVFSEDGKYGGKKSAPLFKLIAQKLLQRKDD